MIHPVDNNSAQPASASKSNGAASASGGASFASALASAQQNSGDAGTVSGGLKTDLTPPKGETWGPVPGHSDYADILSGPRNGFYVSLSGPRKGQAFVIVHKHGQTYHVYGEGKHKHYVQVKPSPSDFKPLKGETWHPVEHHRDFKKIEGGKRDNEFVNLSGNVRTGETFKIEHRNGKTWHVYANGKQVAVGGHRKQSPEKPQAPATTGNPSLPG